MSKLPHDSTNASSNDDKRSLRSDGLYLITSMADTTWRMFVPTIGLLALGYYGDKSFDTTPWLSLAGIICGAAITALLIKQQLQKVKQK